MTRQINGILNANERTVNAISLILKIKFRFPLELRKVGKIRSVSVQKIINSFHFLANARKQMKMLVFEA